MAVQVLTPLCVHMTSDFGAAEGLEVGERLSFLLPFDKEIAPHSPLLAFSLSDRPCQQEMNYTRHPWIDCRPSSMALSLATRTMMLRLS